MSRAQRQKEADRLRRLHWITAVVLLPLAVAAVLRYVVTTSIGDLTDASNRDYHLKSRLDPNTTPWWELTQLSGIGETRARAIVEHRAQTRAQNGDAGAVVFQCADDLRAVKGIGPKTVARIAPHLVFPCDHD